MLANFNSTTSSFKIPNLDFATKDSLTYRQKNMTKLDPISMQKDNSFLKRQRLH